MLFILLEAQPFEAIGQLNSNPFIATLIEPLKVGLLMKCHIRFFIALTSRFTRPQKRPADARQCHQNRAAFAGRVQPIVGHGCDGRSVSVETLERLLRVQRPKCFVPVRTVVLSAVTRTVTLLSPPQQLCDSSQAPLSLLVQQLVSRISSVTITTMPSPMYWRSTVCPGDSAIGSVRRTIFLEMGFSEKTCPLKKILGGSDSWSTTLPGSSM